jgi:carbonic anhydrase/acetyltransferase-like protein (isoleucine patch superfamily)
MIFCIQTRWPEVDVACIPWLTLSTVALLGLTVTGCLRCPCAATTPASAAPAAPAAPAARTRNIRSNVATDFNPVPSFPRLGQTTYVYEDAAVIGSVQLGEQVLVAPHAFIRGDEGQHISIGDGSNVQDCAGIHALESVEQVDGKWHTLAGRLFRSDGTRVVVELRGETERLTRERRFSVWIGQRVSIAHQALVHGPAWVGSDTFIGMQAQIFDAKVGPGSVVLPRALVMGVDVPAGRLVPAGAVITQQQDADRLPPVKGSPYETINRAVVHVNTELAGRYLRTQPGREPAPPTRARPPASTAAVPASSSP